MKLTIILSTIISTFANTVPNLCDEVFLDALGVPLTDDVGQTLSRYCAWTGPDAPAWDADVCCTIEDDEAACSKLSATGCPSGTARRYCKYGAQDALGGVTCYQPFPDGCEAGMCIEAPEAPPLIQATTFVMCCSAGGACQYVHRGTSFDCEGELLSCDYGYVDENDVVECWG